MTLTTAPRRICAVLFDLDGTLIDSVPDITAAVAELMGATNLPVHTENAVRAMIGNGVATLVQRAFAAHGITLAADEHARLTRVMVEDIYPRHTVALTRLMPGAEAALAHLAAAGRRMALVTNKPQAASETIIAHFGLSQFFEVIVGDSPPDAPQVLPRKPAPDMLLFALGRLGVDPQDAAMVGDSAADVSAALAAKVLAVAVRGGYTNIDLEDLGADSIIDQLGELPAVLGLS